MAGGISNPSAEGDRRALGCLARLGAKVNSTEDPREALNAILDEIVHTLGVSSASIALIDPAASVLRIEVSRGLGDGDPEALPLGQGITGWVAVHARSLRVADVRVDPRYRMIRPEVRSELAVPMEILGQVVGVVNCDSDQVGAFDAADEQLLTLVTAEAAKAVGRLWMLGQLRAKTRQLEAILEAGQQLVRERDEPGVAADLIRHARALLGFRAAAYYTLRDGKLVRVATEGVLPGQPLAAELDPSDTVLGTVLKRMRPSEILSATSEPNLIPQAGPELSLLALPVAHEQEPYGVLLGIADGPRRFSVDEQRVLATVVSYAALSLRNLRLYSKAFAAEAELRRGERLTALGMLSAEIAHEIRNPLTVMRLLTDTLGSGMLEGDPKREDLEVMRQKVAHMEGVVSRVLNLARSQSGAFRELRLEEVVAQTALLLRLKLEQARVQLTLETSPEAKAIAGDSGQLQQVLLNLFMNALQAMPSGGTIRLEITHEVAADNCFTVLRLTDTGTGIPQDVRPHIFESFFTGREDGTGLGLAIVKRILRAHRGDIVLESTSAQGTTFRLWLPTV